MNKETKRKKEEMDYTIEEKAMFMREALKEAEIALANDEIPIGCVLVKDGQIIGRGHNAREELQRAVMHAEIMAIEEANQRENSWRLLDTTLFVTIEPCVMCSGAIGLARIPQVIYGATNGITAIQTGRMAHSDISPYFNHIFISEKMGTQKPEALFYEKIAEQIPDFDLSQTLMIGDSLTADIAGANNAGLDSIWYNPKQLENESLFQPTYTAYSYDDIIRLLIP